MARQALPQHIGFIPDGNRRWASNRGLSKEDGYQHGIAPGLALFEACRERGIPEITVYCFTQDNVKRPKAQIAAFQEASVAFAQEVFRRGAALLVVGNSNTPHFPDALRPFLIRQGDGPKVNLLVNYGWDWDLQGLADGRLRSHDISRMDMIVRWGGGRRLSGFLPVQSVYADFFVVDDYWPDYQRQHFDAALHWFRSQDRTLGG